MILKIILITAESNSGPLKRNIKLIDITLIGQPPESSYEPRLSIQ